MRLLATLFVCFCCFVSQAAATDLTIKDIDAPSGTRLGVPVTVGATVANIREYAADNYRVILGIYPFAQAKPVFLDTLLKTNLPPFSETQVTFEPWTALGGKYTICVWVEFADDVNNANNSRTSPLIVDSTRHRYDEAADLILDYLKEHYPAQLQPESQVHVTKQTLPAGTILSTMEGPLDTLTVHTWVGFVNTDKYARWAHNAGLVYFDDGDSLMSYYPLRYPIHINGAVFGSAFDTSTLTHGTPPQTTNGDTNTVTTTTALTAPDTACAIIITGPGNDSAESAAFRTDADMMEKNLRLEPLGPRLSSNNIHRLNAPSPQEVLDLIESLKGRCKTIYFFYSGHGDSVQQAGADVGWMVTRDSGLAYWQLFRGLYGTGAQNINVIIDACHSGSAMVEIEKDERYKDKNITVVTAASADRVSYTNYLNTGGSVTGVGAYTFSFLRFFGDPNAESDGVPGISIAEAHQQVMLRGTDHRDRWLDTLLNSKIYVHRAQVRTDTVSPVGTGVSLVPTTPMGANDAAYITMHAEPFATQPQDTLITYVSPNRYWSIELSAGLKMNYAFQYSAAYDTIPPGETPTVLHRDSSGATWKPYDSTYWDLGSKKVWAYGVQYSADWAMGVAQEPVVAGVENPTRASHTLTVAPNPVRDQTMLRLSIAEKADVRVTLLDVGGRELMTLLAGNLQRGRYELPVSLRHFPAGTYFIRTMGAGHESVAKVIKE